MNNEKVPLECSLKLVKGHSKVIRAHPPLLHAIYQLVAILIRYQLCLYNAFACMFSSRYAVAAIRQVACSMS